MAIASCTVELVAAVFAILLVYWIDKNQQTTDNLITIRQQRLPKSDLHEQRELEAETKASGSSAFRMTEEHNPFL
jgi:hypothetical protein